MKRLCTLAVLCLTIAAHATTYYASPSGTGDGSSESKAGNFTTLVQQLKAGDILYLLAGQYNVVNIQLKTSGTASKPITVCCAPDVESRTPILDFRKQAYGQRGLELKENTDYWIIRGLTLRYSGKNALHNSGSHNIFEDLDVYGNGDTGVQMKAGGDNKIINVDSHDNCDYQLGGTTAADFGGNADGFADKQYTGGANTYIGCRAWNNSDDGWDFFQRVTNGTTSTRLVNCICYQNGPAYYDFSQHGRYETDKKWFDQFKSTITITDKKGNTHTASLSQYPNLGNGNGFKLGGDNTSNLVQLEFCLSVGNTVKGFDQNNNAGTMTIYNCSAYLNGTDYGFANNTNGSRLTIKNCLSYRSKNSNVFKAQTVVSDHNSWNTSGISVSASDFLSLDTTVILTPRQADGSLPETAFLHLKKNSKMIDAGVDVGLDYAGTAPDIGCYEYTDDDILLPATLTLQAGSLSQVVRIGNAITPVVLQWGGGAEDITCSSLPDGIVSTKDMTAKTLTISGTPTQTGNHTVSVSTAGGANTKSITLNIVVKSADAGKQIAYVTLPDNAADALILSKLNTDADFDIITVDATQTIAAENYDLIVISPVPASNASGLTTLKTITKPTLLLKPFMLKSTVWNWGNSQNTTETTIHITVPTHPIFTGITLQEDDQLQLFSAASGNAVTVINGWTNSSVTEIATPVTAEGQNIVEAKAGSNMNGTVIGADFMMIGLSEYSTANLTANALTLIDNACRYLLGLEIASAVTETEATSSVVYQLVDGRLLLPSARTATLYSLTGQALRTTSFGIIETNALKSGIYLLQVENKCTKILLP